MPAFAMRRLRVLVADDCPDTRKSLRMLLKVWGHDCRDVGDGQAAVCQALNYAPDLVLLDILMPELDGYEAARRLRQFDPSLRLVAMSGHTGPGDVLAALEAGFDHFLVKPFDPRELESLLRSFSEKRPLEVV
jgi:CheY-like chemotaxis protein